MRLLRLDLLRYGLFTQKSLTFRPDAKVHVVYGPNEAGKSTALAAIGDLLYGFPNVSQYNFSGDKAPMRLGAEITNRDGQRLTFHRIKSRGLLKTLRTPDDDTLPDNALAPFLGTVDRRMFANAFGLSTEALRLGSRAMLDQEGEIGAALLGAASGVGDLQALQKRLEEEAGDIFKPRKNAKLQFWIAQQRYKDANDARKQSELTSPKWKQLNSEIDALAEKLEALRIRLHDNSTRSNRLNRLTSVRPIINRIGGHLAGIDALGAIGLPSPTFVDDLGQALNDHARAHQTATAAAEAFDKAERDLADITLDEALLASGRTVDILAQDIGSYELAVTRIGEAEEISRRADDALRDLISDLGLPNPDNLAPVELLQRSRPSAAALAGVRELIAERGALDDEARNLGRTIADEEDILARLRHERDAVPSLIDPASFRMSLEAFEADLAALSELDDLELAVAEESRRLLEEAGRLSPEAADLDLLAGAPRPSAETIQRYRIEFDRHGAERDRAEATLFEARQTSDVIRQNLDQLQVDGEVVTPEALASARADRDFIWSGLRQSLLAEEKPNPADLGSSIATFEIAVARADTLADAAIRDAKRIEAFRQQSLNLRDAEDKIKRQSDTIMLNDEAQATLRDIWADEWRDMGLIPLRPAEMADWLVKVEALLERRDAVERQRTRLALIDQRAEALRRPLADLGQQMGLSAIDGLSPQAIATRIRARLADLSRTWEDARDITIRIEDCTGRLAGLQAVKAVLDEKIAAWEPRWAEASSRLGLRHGATITEASAALAVFERLPQAIEALTTAGRRIDELRATISGFDGPALELTERVAPDLNSLAPHEAIGRLAERLREARDALAARKGVERRLADARTARATAAETIALVDARLADLRQQAELDETADLVDLHLRLSRFAAISLDLRSARAELAEQAAGDGEDDLRAALLGFDLDAAKAERDELAREYQRMEDERLKLYAAWDALVRQRDALETGTGAELALQRRALAESDMANLTRDWLVLKLAATLVAKATARHRAGHHVPLVERAGNLFSALTGGSFAGLVTEDDDKGRERLVGRRPDGSTVEIGRSGSGIGDEESPGGMSEGTLDQLYLAMRLAHLEDFARTSEPAPFIGDDVFITFDDTRTALGLEALAETSSLIQPIIFTHHARVADIARFRLGEAADIIEL
jgi:uncharacterized protein YhaN